MQRVALAFIVGFSLVLHIYLSLVAIAVANLAKLTVSQWGFASLLSSFFVIAGVIFSANRNELVINAPKTQIILQEKVGGPSDSATENEMIGSIWARIVRLVRNILLSFLGYFDGGTVLFLCVVHNVAIWLVLGTLDFWFDFETSLVVAVLMSLGITFLARTVRKVGPL